VNSASVSSPASQFGLSAVASLVLLYDELL
jgi:hypothetical protein